MSSAVATLPLAPDSVTPIVIESQQRFLLAGVGWDNYIAIGKALGERGNLRLTYDEGRLELMTVSTLHELVKYLLSRLVDVISEEMGVEVNGYGNMTHQRPDLAKGLEPDACFYIKNFEKVRGLTQIDLERDPPPDLILEIDIASSSIERMPIYEKIGVPELWRFEGQAIQVYVLNARGHLEKSERSPTFPSIPIDGLLPFLRTGISQGATSMVRAFRPWVRPFINGLNGGQ